MVRTWKQRKQRKMSRETFDWIWFSRVFLFSMDIEEEEESRDLVGRRARGGRVFEGEGHGRRRRGRRGPLLLVVWMNPGAGHALSLSLDREDD